VIERLAGELRDAGQTLVAPREWLVILARIGSIAIIILGAAFAIRLAAALIGRILAPRGDRLLDETRARTLQPLTESLVRYIIYFIALVMVLREVNIDATAILESAGVVGLAFGFGAQNLIRDVISGFFLLFEGLIQVGDVIAVGEHSGLVERISIRTTQIRKFSGELWTIPNGQLQIFGNFNRDFMSAIVEVGIAYEGDIERAMALMQQVGEEWVAEHSEIALGPPEVQGVHQFREAEVAIRLVIKVKPLEQWAAERELRKRVKLAFDREADAVPFPRRVVVTYVHPHPQEGRNPSPGQSPGR
jgi:small conductance mechanosensitive channel